MIVNERDSQKHAVNYTVAHFLWKYEDILQAMAGNDFAAMFKEHTKLDPTGDDWRSIATSIMIGIDRNGYHGKANAVTRIITLTYDLAHMQESRMAPEERLEKMIESMGIEVPDSNLYEVDIRDLNLIISNLEGYKKTLLEKRREAQNSNSNTSK